MERYRRGKGKQRLLGSHQKCWLWGRHAVLETLRAGRWPILDLHLAAELDAAERGEAEQLARERRLEIRIRPARELRGLCHSAEHQGYLAKMGEFPYAAEASLPLGARPLCVLLDRVQDPYNFGAMLRSAEVFAADAVFIGEREQVGVTSMVARSSAGAVNRVPIVRVAELEAAADRLRARGLTLVGASEKGEGILTGVDFTRPVAVMIGSEGVGIRDSLTSRCERLVRIPQAGRIGSLNAAVAASIFLYEARRQRGFAA